MKGAIPIIAFLLLASMFGYVQASEVHKNGFGGVTPSNTTGLTIFNDTLKRSFVYESDSLVLAAEFSILETDGVIRDFSPFDNDLTVSRSIPLPIQDSSVSEFNPDANLGSAIDLTVKSSSANDNYRSFIEFNISETSRFQDAQLRLLKHTNAGTGFPRTYEVCRVTESWVESVVTWNNQPAINTTTCVSTTVSTTLQWYSWDITTFTQGWVDGNFANYGVRLNDSDETASGGPQSLFHSREATVIGNRPILDGPIDSPKYVSSTFRTALETINGPTSAQWAETPSSESLEMENTNVSMVWWGQIRDSSSWRYVMGKACSGGIPYVYGLILSATFTIEAMVSNSTCASDTIQSILPSGGLSLNQTYGIGIVFEDNVWGTDVHFWLDGEWIYNETSTERVGEGGSFYVGRSIHGSADLFCNCTHDEVSVFKERLNNDTMKLLTTQQHDIVIKSGPSTTPQGFGGLFFALPWIIVFGLLAWVFYAIGLSLKNIFGD